MPYELPQIEGQPTVEEIKAYLLVAIGSYQGDPADNAFQRGFLAACESIYSDLFMTREERAADADLPK